MIHTTKSKTVILALLGAVLVSVLLIQIYQTIDERNEKLVQRTEEFRAEVETPAKKVLNGYLGVFFRFRYLGNLNWLAIPLAVWFLFTGRTGKRERWQLALVFVWLVSLLFIGAKGYLNSRYQLTLFPFTMGMVLLLTWEWVKEKKIYFKVLIFSLLMGLCIFNVVHYFPQYRWFWELKVSRDTDHFPRKIVSFLRRNKTISRNKNKVYVFNLPLYYYHTGKFGVDYVNPNRIDILKEFKEPRINKEKLHRLVRRRHKIKYIFIDKSMEEQYKDRVLSEFLNCQCRLLFNEHGDKLYEVRKLSLDKELQTGKYEWLPTVWVFNMDVQVIRGTFEFQRDRKKRVMKIYNKTPGEEGRRLVQLGFDSGAAKYKLTVPQGRYVHMVVEARLPQRLLNKENYMFIRDMKENEKSWSTTRQYFTSGLWRTYLVSRKIRPGSNRFIMGVRFSSKSPKDQLFVRKIKAYVSDHPL